MLDELGHRIGSITTPWWGVVAGAAVVGAIIFVDARVTGALVGGGVAFAIAVHQAPCCAGCAAGKGCAGTITPAPKRRELGAATAGGDAFSPQDVLGSMASSRAREDACGDLQ